MEEYTRDRRRTERDSGERRGIVKDLNVIDQKWDRHYVQASMDLLGGLGVGWSVTYYVILIAGAVAFHRRLWPLTESESALAQFG